MPRRNRRFGVAVVAAAIAVLASAAAASAGNGSDFNYVPDSFQGPAVVNPTFPGVGNDCTPLFGTPFTISCFDPTEMREAYNVPSSLDGAGQTIVIVDA